jgi:hypothetical protein
VIAQSMLPDRPPSRVRHSWRCVRRGPLLETVRRLPTGEAVVVEQCAECHGDDLADRLRRQKTGEVER